MAESIRGTTLERNELPEPGVRLRFGGPLICDSGDIMLDALRHDLEGLPEDDSFTEEFSPDSYLVCTMHRAANVDDRAIISHMNFVSPASAAEHNARFAEVGEAQVPGLPGETDFLKVDVDMLHEQILRIKKTTPAAHFAPITTWPT